MSSIKVTRRKKKKDKAFHRGWCCEQNGIQVPIKLLVWFSYVFDCTN